MHKRLQFFNIIFSLFFISTLSAFTSFIHNTQQKPQSSLRNYHTSSPPSSAKLRTQQYQKKQIAKINKFKAHQKQLYDAHKTLFFSDAKNNTKIIDHWNTQLILAQKIQDHEREKLINNRLIALQTSMSKKYKAADYSNHETAIFYTEHNNSPFALQYGTKLDELLHQELIATGETAYRLAVNNGTNMYVKMLIPLVGDFLHQAKQEQNILDAFNIADAAYDIVTIVQYGITKTSQALYAVGKGTFRGIKVITTPEHWKQMAIGMAQLLRDFGEICADQQNLESGIIIPKEKLQSFFTILNKPLDKSDQDTLFTHLQKNYTSFITQSWDAKIETCAELGTILLLDTVMLNAAGWATKTTGRAILNQIATIFKQGSNIITEYSVEATGIGKLIVNKGQNVVISTLCEVEKHPEIITKLKLSIPKIIAEEAEFIHASTPVGRKGFKDPPIFLTPRKPAIIYNRIYSGHAIQRMQERGFTPIIIENAIEYGELLPSSNVDRFCHYDVMNNVMVITKKIDGSVISVMYKDQNYILKMKNKFKDCYE